MPGLYLSGMRRSSHRSKRANESSLLLTAIACVGLSSTWKVGHPCRDIPGTPPSPAATVGRCKTDGIAVFAGMSEEAIMELNLPTGIPIVYELDKNLKPVKPMQFLGDEETVRKAMEAVAAQGKAKK